MTSEYVAPLAPGIAAQAPAMQRSQLRAYVIGVVPDQVPTDALRVWPTLVVPDTVGVAVFAGGMGGGGGDRDAVRDHDGNHRVGRVSVRLVGDDPQPVRAIAEVFVSNAM